MEGAQATDQELPVRSEVDQAGVERHREAQADEDERRGADQGLGDRSKGCRDVVGVAALDRGDDATRVADRPGEHRAVAVDHAGESAADRCERIGADVSQVLEVGQHDEDRAQDEGCDQGECRDDVRDAARRGSAACRRVSPSAHPVRPASLCVLGPICLGPAILPYWSRDSGSSGAWLSHVLWEP